MKALRVRNVAILAVAAISALFGTVLVEAIALITAGIAARGANSGVVSILLSSLGSVFFGIALYVGAITTANVVATVLAGRTRVIALLRLVGATGPSLRRRVVLAGLEQGVVGSAIGVAIGLGVTQVSVGLAVSAGWVEQVDFAIISPALIAPILGVVLATVLASFIGSRAVLEVSPIQATGATVERLPQSNRQKWRLRTGMILLGVGLAFFVLGVFVGQESPLGVIVAFGGGVVSSAGIIVAAPTAIPPVLGLVGRGMGSHPVARLAAKNPARNPAGATRVTLGLGIGITLVTTFATVLQQFRLLATKFNDATDPEAILAIVDAITLMLVVLVGFSALLAAVGMVSTLLQSVLQRRRELALLRALGFTITQVRQMIAVEAIQVVATATIGGLLLGSLYGWAGAQSAFGSLTKILLPLSMPVPVIAGVVLTTATITVVASLVAARPVTRVSPVEALAEA